MGVGNERISFRVLPATKAICIYHKGTYDRLGEAYAYIYRYAMENGYKPIVEEPAPEDGYWVPKWHETEEEIVLEWVETEPPAEEELLTEA